jgi:hypothetical protein
MKIMEAASVEEAVALAESLKAKGRYDWFRGQLRAWTPSSSLERALNGRSDVKQQLDAKLSRFLSWAVNQPSLAYLALEENVDSLFAVLQHYGFPTSYIDFSTEPAIAGFFASDSQSPPQEPGSSVIYCLNTTELKEFYEFLSQADEGFQPVAETVTVDVANLWRLQSQHGHFLFANHPWYRFFEMDKILFPWNGAPAFPPREHIYPLHKSALEQLLDSYFFEERRFENAAAVCAMEEGRGEGGLFRHFEIEMNEAYDRDAFTYPLEITEHWSDQALKDWRNTPVELFYSTVGRQISMPLRTGVTAPSAANQIRHSIKGALSMQPELRSQAVEWSFTGLPDDVDETLFKAARRDAWNGMRNLPYTSDDIAAAISALVVLCAIPECRSIDGSIVDQAFTRWIPDAIYVEFGYPGSSYSRAYASDSALRNALDPSWTARLKDASSLVSMTSAFHSTHDPRLMFDFSQLASIFAREIIPAQLAMKRALVLFNPADLEVFGLP